MAGVDVVTFFREATLRICGGLDLGCAAGSCLEYLRAHLPVDHLLITYNDEEEGVERALVRAGARRVELLDLALPLSEDAAASRWGEVLGWGQEISAVSLPLQEGDWRSGTVHFVAEGRDRLGPLQAQLLDQLGGAVSVALSNYMRHVEALAQRQQLAEENRRLRAALEGRSPDGDGDGDGDRAEALQALERTLTRALSICRSEPGPAVGPLPDDDEGVGWPAPAAAEELRLDRLMSRHIQRVLRRTGGRVEGAGGAAALLGLHPSTLRKRMRKLGVPFGRRSHGS